METGQARLMSFGRSSIRQSPLLLGALLAFFVATNCSAADASSYQAWVPPGWKLLLTTTGDLNRDGQDDVALILQQADPALVRKNDGLGAETLDLNPRRLVVLLHKADGLRKVASVDRFLPKENDAEQPCLEDPLAEGGIQITRGLLQIDLQYWTSCGSWWVSHRTFSFRLESAGERFRLVGLDGWESKRSTGERSEYSKNYLTGKQKITEGLNELEASTPTIKWKTIQGRTTFFLDEMTSSCSEGEQTQDWCR
jgi:hypothetical protein